MTLLCYDTRNGRHGGGGRKNGGKHAHHDGDGDERGRGGDYDSAADGGGNRDEAKRS